MFMLTSGGAMAMSTVPDICKTPAPPAGPVPIPYPNMADTSAADPGGLVKEVLVDGMPAMNMSSKVLITSGDEAGVAGGVTSGKVKGEMKFTNGSSKVTVGGKPAVRVTDQTMHNANNTMGMFSKPSQTDVLVME
ncbi:PAAR motif protein [compost metagenome]